MKSIVEGRMQRRMEVAYDGEMMKEKEAGARAVGEMRRGMLTGSGIRCSSITMGQINKCTINCDSIYQNNDMHLGHVTCR